MVVVEVVLAPPGVQPTEVVVAADWLPRVALVVRAESVAQVGIQVAVRQVPPQETMRLRSVVLAVVVLRDPTLGAMPSTAVAVGVLPQTREHKLMQVLRSSGLGAAVAEVAWTTPIPVRHPMGLRAVPTVPSPQAEEAVAERHKEGRAGREHRAEVPTTLVENAATVGAVERRIMPGQAGQEEMAVLRVEEAEEVAAVHQPVAPGAQEEEEK